MSLLLHIQMNLLCRNQHDLLVFLSKYQLVGCLSRSLCYIFLILLTIYPYCSVTSISHYFAWNKLIEIKFPRHLNIDVFTGCLRFTLFDHCWELYQWYRPGTAWNWEVLQWPPFLVECFHLEQNNQKLSNGKVSDQNRGRSE